MARALVDLTEESDDEVVEIAAPPAMAHARRNAPRRACTRCKHAAPNPGYDWCAACYSDHCRQRDALRCINCHTTRPNPGYELCQQCFVSLYRSDPVRHAGFGRGARFGHGVGLGHGGGGRGGGAQEPGAPPENASYDELNAWIAQQGDVSLGLTRAQLARLPERPYRGAHADALQGADAQCSICLCEYDEGDALTILPGCMHAFHQACVVTWLGGKPTCPACQRDVRADVTRGAAGVAGSSRGRG